MKDALYKQLGNLFILLRKSALRSANKTDKPILDVLRKAPILSSTEEQYSAATLAQIATVEQSLTHQNTASCVSSSGKNGRQMPSKLASRSTWGAPCVWLQRSQAVLLAVSVRDGTGRGR